MTIGGIVSVALSRRPAFFTKRAGRGGCYPLSLIPLFFNENGVRTFLPATASAAARQPSDASSNITLP